MRRHLGIENYKVLGAMLALREFTVAELADYSGVLPVTVHTVLGREKYFLDENSERQKTHRRGGQIHRYRLKSDRIQDLRTEIENLFQEVREIRHMDDPTVDRESTKTQIPLGILAAEDTLLRLFPKTASVDERRNLLESAALSFASARRDLDGSANSGDAQAAKTQAHFNLVDKLIAFCSAELDERSAVDGDLSFLTKARDQLLDVGRELRNIGEDDSATKILARLQNSPVGVDFIVTDRRGLRNSSPGRVTIIDGIPSKSDKLTPRVRQFLLALEHGRDRLVDEYKLSNIAELWASRANNLVGQVLGTTQQILLTVDSKSHRAPGISAIESAVAQIASRCLSPKEQMFVLDSNASTHLQNQVLKHGGQYVSNARSLEQDALGGALFGGRAAFGQDTLSAHSSLPLPPP